jgi:DNA-binding CsgD family transcriptional regulator
MTASNSTQTRRAELHFRQTCCLSMSGPMTAPSVFRDLQSVVPHTSCLFMWLGPSGPVDVYFNLPEVGRYLPLYAEKYFRGSEHLIWATTDEAAAFEFGPKLLDDVLRVPRSAYFRHPIYNEILRPSHACSFIRLLIRDRGRPIGTFTVGRAADEPEFSLTDRQAIARLEPYIVHALARHEPKVDLADAVGYEDALILIDSRGRQLAQSHTANTLLSLSQGNRLAAPRLHGALLGLISTLQEIASEKSPKVPVWRTRNAWGAFVARAYWMDGAMAASPLIGIHLQRRVPRRLVILENLRQLGLPPQQEYIALLLALGRTEAQAAEDLQLSRNTVVYHRRQIYNRLDVDSRASLVQRLWRSSESAQTESQRFGACT